MDISDNPTRREYQYGTESISEVTQDNNRAIINIKNWKAPGSEEIPGEINKYGRGEMHHFMYRLCQNI